MPGTPLPATCQWATRGFFLRLQEPICAQLAALSGCKRTLQVALAGRAVLK